MRELKLSAMLPIPISTLRGQRMAAYFRLGGRGDGGLDCDAMAAKAKVLTLGQVGEALKAHGFAITSEGNALRVTKYGCGAVLVASQEIGDEVGTSTGRETAVAYKESPGAVVGGELARLLDRGYQKFLKTSKYEVPATAAQLQGIHRFSEELALVTGGVSLYNESLGTTSDVYQYDRVKGREAAGPKAARPWELEAEAGH